MELIGMAALAGIICIVLWMVLHGRGAARDVPALLRDAPIAAAERTFRAPSLRVVARIDRAYKLDDRWHLVELKTRKIHRVYSADVIELSVQKYAIEEETGERVDDSAHVATQAGTERRWHTVHLLSREEVAALLARRKSILAGRAEPNFARSEGPCRNCLYRKECQPPAVRHR